MEHEQTRFMRAQIRRIEIDKWIEGVHRKCDPGSDYVFRWIGKYANDFRTQWERSQCKACSNWYDCGHAVRTMCPDFKPAQ